MDVGGPTSIKTGDRELKTGDRQKETGDRELKTGDQKLKTGDQKLKTGDQKLKTGDRGRSPLRKDYPVLCIICLYRTEEDIQDIMRSDVTFKIINVGDGRINRLRRPLCAVPSCRRGEQTVPDRVYQRGSSL
ncbi:hypothetical protein FACS1894187_19650 [Synergistales bacterium]|nr:hypothetical protein FACS1894187_19650 [Synergistales bacterium]